jgi:DNA repair photolyase
VFEWTVRWDRQTLTAEEEGALPGLGRLAGLVRTVRTPEFAGTTFHEVHCRSALNPVPNSAHLPFRWTINPYRGCTHGCVYCFARQTHTYLEFDSGQDFDSEIVVKTNIAAVLRRELARPSWTREPVAMGTNTDPYQRAEGRYRLMPDIVSALTAADTPFSILTKGTMLSRDLPLLAAAAEQVPVSVSISLAVLDPELQPTLEPGTPTPRARLDLVRRVRAAGLPCGVLLAPILPHLTDSTEHLEALVAELAAAGATSIGGIVLHLRPGAREWFFAWLDRRRPELRPAYERLYGKGANASVDYRREVQARLRVILDRTQLDRGPARPVTSRAPAPATAGAASKPDDVGQDPLPLP